MGTFSEPEGRVCEESRYGPLCLRHPLPLSVRQARPQVQQTKLWGIKHHHIIGILRTNHKYKS